MLFGILRQWWSSRPFVRLDIFLRSADSTAQGTIFAGPAAHARRHRLRVIFVGYFRDVCGISRSPVFLLFPAPAVGISKLTMSKVLKFI